MRDFEDELPGYLNNRKIADALDALSLKSGTAHLTENLLICYERLIEMELVGAEELGLVEAWSADLAG
jgi:hypothetical protein